MKRLCLSLVFVALVTLPSAANPARDHVITAEDYFSQVYISGSSVSPDGRLVAYTEKRWDKVADKRLTEIWLTDTAKGEARRVTFDGASKSTMPTRSRSVKARPCWSSAARARSSKAA